MPSNHWQIFALGLGLAVLPAPASAADGPLSDQASVEIGQFIRSKGFNCPRAREAYAAPQDAYGHVLRVYCGPVDTSQPPFGFAFRVTLGLGTLGAITVRPWQEK